MLAPAFGSSAKRYYCSPMRLCVSSERASALSLRCRWRPPAVFKALKASLNCARGLTYLIHFGSTREKCWHGDRRFSAALPFIPSSFSLSLSFICELYPQRPCALLQKQTKCGGNISPLSLYLVLTACLKTARLSLGARAGEGGARWPAINEPSTGNMINHDA